MFISLYLNPQLFGSVHNSMVDLKICLKLCTYLSDACFLHPCLYAHQYPGIKITFLYTQGSKRSARAQFVCHDPVLFLRLSTVCFFKGLSLLFHLPILKIYFHLCSLHCEPSESHKIVTSVRSLLLFSQRRQ